MMGKVYTQRSFTDRLSYCLEDKPDEVTGQVLYKDRAEILYYSQCFGDKEELIRQFQEVRKLNPGLKEPVMHISLSLPNGETRPKGDLVDLATDCAEAMGFSHHQYVVILHKDTPQQHFHIVVNRIGFDKKTLSDSYSKGRIADYCRAAEIKHGLIQESGPTRYLKKEQGQRIRSGIRLDRLKEEIGDALDGCRDLGDFERSMRQKGYTVYKSQGYAFMDQKKVLYKGSEAGFPFRIITDIIKQNQEKHALKENTWIQHLYQKEKEGKEQLLKEQQILPDPHPEIKGQLNLPDRHPEINEQLILTDQEPEIEEQLDSEHQLEEEELKEEQLKEEQLSRQLPEEHQQKLTHHFKIRGL